MNKPPKIRCAQTFNDFLKCHSINDMSLTTRMCEKNDFSRCSVYYTEDSDGISGLCIFEEFNGYIRIDVLEVREDCRNSGLGTRLIDKVKELRIPIGLHSLEESLGFYERMGFYISEEGCFELEYTD